MALKNQVVKLIKRVLGVENLSLYIKKRKRNIFKRVYRKKYSADDLVSVMKNMGLSSGSVIFIHSSMTEFYNYTGTAEELINKVIDVIGEEGTLMMPAYPKNKKKLMHKVELDGEVDFDVLETPSGAGYLTEVFRKYPGVKRSINLQHSVCAYGKLADYFTSEHHLSQTAWDEFSPYYKMGRNGALIFSLGLTPYLRNVTLIHCTESFFRNKYKYFASFFSNEICYKYKDYNGVVSHHKMVWPNSGVVRSRYVIKKYFDKSKFLRFQLSNLLIEMIDAKYMFERCIELINHGQSIYSNPQSKEYIRKGQFIEVNNNEQY